MSAKTLVRQAPTQPQTSLPGDPNLRNLRTHPIMRPTTKTALRRVAQTSHFNTHMQQSSIVSSLSRSSRSFHASAAQHTDGVFRELTSMRVRTPWVEAFRNQQAGGKSSAEPVGKPRVPKDRQLTPKHMDESYHSVVLPLARDPWLLDTYLNASGHIRLGTIFMDLDALSGIIA